MTINLIHADLAEAVAALSQVAERLEDRRAATEQQVDTLAERWSGAAATTYVEGWEEWRSGSREVTQALRAMADLIVTAGRDLGEADESSRTASAALAGRVADRLVERLG
ncbi:WXG100 family type VII secretion target [Nocardioides sp.]|jgi:WXG100 family type VII secretion target|uniref:WXG100 family type VII secretion target n=1 Tax=Nocardioides sp. TaxID=35761 RepID=UPI0026037980|nr:WXG100 family type VII secretion target [Nocardioides sp.]